MLDRSSCDDAHRPSQFVSMSAEVGGSPADVNASEPDRELVEGAISDTGAGAGASLSSDLGCLSISASRTKIAAVQTPSVSFSAFANARETYPLLLHFLRVA